MSGRTDLEEIASEYDSLSDFDHWAIDREAEMFLEEYDGGSVLELGCARGGMTRRFAAVVDRLVVVDGAQKYLAELRDIDTTIELVHTRFETFAPTERFQHIMAARILEHLDDPVGFLRRLRGWLAPEGVLHVIVPNARSFHRMLGVEMGLIADIHELGERDLRVGHVRVYDSDILGADLENAGLRVLSRQDVMIKVLSNTQMETWDPQVIRGLFKLATHFPDHGNELYFRCTADVAYAGAAR